MKRVLNCWPWVRSLIHSPDAVTHSPAEMMAAWPTTVTRSRWPRALIRRTQKPVSALWKVTRSTRPARTSPASDLDSNRMQSAARVRGVLSLSVLVKARRNQHDLADVLFGQEFLLGSHDLLEPILSRNQRLELAGLKVTNKSPKDVWMLRRAAEQ